MNPRLKIIAYLETIFFAVTITAVMLGCKKDRDNTDPDPPAPDHTPVPRQEIVTTDIMGYITNDQGIPAPSSGHFRLINDITGELSAYTLLPGGTFSTGPVATDRTMTRSLVTPGSGNYLITQKTFSVSPSLKSYTRIKMLNSASIGEVVNVTGGTVNFNGGGSITYGSNTFFEAPVLQNPGFFDPSIRAKIHITYHDPQDAQFALRLPCYLAADSDSKRWFLKSYGAISMEMASGQLTRKLVDFYSGGVADLKLPIPSSMQPGAPESIDAWRLDNGRWTKAAKAVKTGNYYVAKINKSTAWTFAVPVKGLYLTVKVRADSASVTNTSVRVKSNGRVIAESETDADGDALCFVPSNEALVVEVLPDERVFLRDVYSFNVAPLAKAESVTVNLDANTIPALSTLYANVRNCNNAPIANGMVNIKFDNRNYYFPVKNGKLSSALWVNANGYAITGTVTDFSNNTTADLSNIHLLWRTSQHVNFYNCNNSSRLYCNFTIDGKKYELNDDATASSPYMTCSKATPVAFPTIKTNNGSNTGINFTAWPISQGIWENTLFHDLMINGVAYQRDGSKPSSLVYHRFDQTINGYVEGWFSFNYLDNANVSHHVEGNFKVKRVY